jgi:sulfide:quinone oxidoreductase
MQSTASVASLPLRARSGRRPHVLVAGGGIAGLEALLALHALAGSRVTVELMAPDPDFLFRPMTVAEPFGAGSARRLALAEVCAQLGAAHRRDAVDVVDAARHRVETVNGELVEYDALILASGARRAPAPPGAVGFDGPEGVEGMRRVLADLDAERIRHVVFAVPDGVSWPLPLYELALMTATHASDRGLEGVQITLVTPEDDPLEVFGRPAHARLRALLRERGVELRTTSRPFELAQGLLLTSGGALPVHRLVTLPRIEGPRIAGVPHDDEGFVPIDEHAAVVGSADVYAAGDGVSFPVKQGGIATQMADAAAAAIAARAGAPITPEPFAPELRGLLLTGAIPLYLRDARGGAGAAAARTPPWNPPGKVAGRYLAPFLAEHGHHRLPGDPEPTLSDRAPEPFDPEEHEAALDLALTLADEEAEMGEPGRALTWLDTAEALGGTLPPAYAEKRRIWEGRVPAGARVRSPAD